MAKFRVPCFWTMAGWYEIEADDADEAYSIAEDLDNLPDNGMYVDSSFEIEAEAIERIS